MLPYWRLHQQFVFFLINYYSANYMRWCDSIVSTITRDPRKNHSIFSWDVLPSPHFCQHNESVFTERMQHNLFHQRSEVLHNNGKKNVLPIHTVLYTVNQYSCFFGGNVFVYTNIVGGYCRITVYVCMTVCYARYHPIPHPPVNNIEVGIHLGLGDAR